MTTLIPDNIICHSLTNKSNNPKAACNEVRPSWHPWLLAIFYCLAGEAKPSPFLHASSNFITLTSPVFFSASGAEAFSLPSATSYFLHLTSTSALNPSCQRPTDSEPCRLRSHIFPISRLCACGPADHHPSKET